MSKRLTTIRGSLQVDCTLKVALTYCTLSDLNYYDKVFFVSLAKGLGYSVICRTTVWMMQSTLISIISKESLHDYSHDIREVITLTMSDRIDPAINVPTGTNGVCTDFFQSFSDALGSVSSFTQISDCASPLVDPMFALLCEDSTDISLFVYVIALVQGSLRLLFLC